MRRDSILCINRFRFEKIISIYIDEVLFLQRERSKMSRQFKNETDDV